jgi:hypothetical protein
MSHVDPLRAKYPNPAEPEPNRAHRRPKLSDWLRLGRILGNSKSARKLKRPKTTMDKGPAQHSKYFVPKRREFYC